jgi:hypothetical protein
VEKSGFKVGFLHVDAPTVEDIAKVRRCGEKVINLVRSEEYLARNSLAVAGFQNHAIQKTLVADRDLVLAHSMHRPAGGERVKKVVGVVGAGHIPGIERHWDSLSTDESRDAYNEALNPIPADASDSSPRLAGFGSVPRRRRRGVPVVQKTKPSISGGGSRFRAQGSRPRRRIFRRNGARGLVRGLLGDAIHGLGGAKG